MATYDGYTVGESVEFKAGDIINFDYTGALGFLKIRAVLQIECWGASGGNALRGKGAYTRGTLRFVGFPSLVVAVGKAGAVHETNPPDCNFNGGGRAHNTYNVASGGGAADVRLSGTAWDEISSLRSRIMVAAGGGGMSPNWNRQGGHGGKLTGFAGANAPGGAGTQTSGGAAAVGAQAGSFGKGGRGGWQASGAYIRSGAGSGYYGGGGGEAAGGGSSFISGYTGCNAIKEDGTHTGQPIHYSGLVFESSFMAAGNESMPNPRGTGNITGNVGNAYVRITVLEIIPNENRLYFKDTDGVITSVKAPLAQKIWYKDNSNKLFLLYDDDHETPKHPVYNSWPADSTGALGDIVTYRAPVSSLTASSPLADIDNYLIPCVNKIPIIIRTDANTIPNITGTTRFMFVRPTDIQDTRSDSKPQTGANPSVTFNTIVSSSQFTLVYGTTNWGGWGGTRTMSNFQVTFNGSIWTTVSSAIASGMIHPYILAGSRYYNANYYANACLGFIRDGGNSSGVYGHMYYGFIINPGYSLKGLRYTGYFDNYSILVSNPRDIKFLASSNISKITRPAAESIHPITNRWDFIR